MYTLNDIKFYRTTEIDKEKAHYNVIFGERSNGKTTSVLEIILKNWINKGEQGVYLRRYDEHIKGNKGSVIWSSIVHERDLVNKWTKGNYQSIIYRNRAWHLAKYDEKLDKDIPQKEPFCYALAVNQEDKYKGTSYPRVTTICFDECMARESYLIDEFTKFHSIMSSVIRQRDNVIVYLLGNTVDMYCPYFEDMGLTNARKMKQGSIELYTYGESDLKVAVEYCSPTKGGKKSDVYFAFDNPKLNMIKTGAWELPLYPHAPFQIDHKSIVDHFFINHLETILQGDIVVQDDCMFIYIHIKTTPLKDDIKQTYSLEHNPKYNHAISITDRHRNKISAKIGDMFAKDLVYFQDNNIGELVRSYINQSSSRNSII